jgi:hypothetical protein
MKRTALKRKTPLKRVAIKRKPAKKRPLKAKRKSLRTLKKKAWELLSKAIRLERREGPGLLVECVSCQRKMPWKQIQAGHFIDGRFNSILFDELGIHPQCGLCNVVYNGRKEEYFIYMERTWGREVIDELRAQRNKQVNFTAEELESMIEQYRQRIADEINTRGPE